MKQQIESVEEPTSESSKETLANIAALLDGNLVSPMHALHAAYTLGLFDGKMEMARVGTARD